ncbi:MAG: hypothetical protein P4L49_08435 [Desulfosporosinus sp.]|nr:hypothetical protein [Desulfosporosinus sp.]
MRKVLGTLLFVALLITSGCSTKSASNVQTNTSQPSPVPSAPQAQSANVISQLTFRWIDLKTDILNPKGLTTDGNPDGHFHLTMAFAEATKIKYIIMRYTEFGEHIQWAWEYNTTVPIVGSPLAVFNNGTLVSSGTDKGLACPVGDTDLDLYIPELNNENGRDTFKFESGQNITIQMKYITKAGQEKEFDSTTVIQL